jgi:methionyl-tRNA formyltransferase
MGSFDSKRGNGTLKIVFFGNHLYGHHSLWEMIMNDFCPQIVVTNIPSPSEKTWYPSVGELAELHNIKVIKQNKIAGDQRLREYLQSLSPDLYVLSSFRNLLDAELLALPSMGAINLHMAPLPRYRGAHPENWAIINGEKKMGFTVHFLDEGIDSGDILLQDEISIMPEDDILSLTFKLAIAGPSLLVNALHDIKSGTIKRIPQLESDASYYPPRTPKDGFIDWSQRAYQIQNLVRALTIPYPGAFTYCMGNKVTVWRVRLVDLDYTEIGAGNVIYTSAEGIVVKTGDGTLLISDFDLGGDLNIKDLKGRKFADIQ